MKEFDITITETLSKTVSVLADRQEEAELAVMRQYQEEVHILDESNFVGVDFEATGEREAVPTLTALLVEPGRAPQVVELPDTLSALQTAVGGNIETISPFLDPVAIICGEEAKLEGQMPNRALYNREGDLADIIAGPFLVTGLGDDSFISLPPDLLSKYRKHFAKPEQFYTLCGQIVVKQVEAPKPIPQDKHKVRPSER